MSPYEDMDAAELRLELEDWTARTLQWADDIVNAIEAQDPIRAACITPAYRQSQLQMRRIRKCLQIGVA